MSTITGADQILVLHAGKVAESGTHQELLAMKGRYANMWKKQIRAERAAEAASQMVAKANALREAAMDRPGSSGNEDGPSEDVSENEADDRGGATFIAPSSTSLSTRALLHATEQLHDVDSPAGGSKSEVQSAADEGNAVETDATDPKAQHAGSSRHV